MRFEQFVGPDLQFPGLQPKQGKILFQIREVFLYDRFIGLSLLLQCVTFPDPAFIKGDGTVIPVSKAFLKRIRINRSGVITGISGEGGSVLPRRNAEILGENRRKIGRGEKTAGGSHIVDGKGSGTQ